ncbi:MAG TPA: hypothetical protein VMQ62_04535 [Dongiaceae bacterium]|nr:hypothetical protein [Dongiaceae bacterium]
MTPRAALAFVKRHGVVLMAARGPVPSLADRIAGGPFRGSWWGHPRAQEMFRIFGEIGDSRDILVCRLVEGKVTYVHRRLWPALARLSGSLPRRALAAIHEEHTASGKHRLVVVPYPRWAPKPTLARGKALTLEAARAAHGPAIAPPETAARRPSARRRPTSRRGAE